MTYFLPSGDNLPPEIGMRKYDAIVAAELALAEDIAAITLAYKTAVAEAKNKRRREESAAGIAHKIAVAKAETEYQRTKAEWAAGIRRDAARNG